VFQAKNSNQTVIHKISVEADTTGYVEPADEDEEELLRETWSIPGNGDDHHQGPML
jgi:hypothetical protein